MKQLNNMCVWKGAGVSVDSRQPSPNILVLAHFTQGV